LPPHRSPSRAPWPSRPPVRRPTRPSSRSELPALSRARRPAACASSVALDLPRLHLLTRTERLDGFVSGFPCSYPNDLLERRHEDLAVAHLAGVRGLRDHLEALIELAVVDRDFHLHFRQEVDDVLGASIELCVPFLAAEALDLGNGHAVHAHLRE